MRALFLLSMSLLAFCESRAQPRFSWARRDGSITYTINPSYPRQVVSAQGGKALWGVIQNNRMTYGQVMLGDYKVMELDAAGGTTATTNITGKFSLTDAQADAAGNWYLLGFFYDSVRCANGLNLVRGASGPESNYFMLRLHAGTLAADWLVPLGANSFCGTECFTLTGGGLYFPVDSSSGSSINRLDLATGTRTRLWTQAGRSYITTIQADGSGAVYVLGHCTTSGAIGFNGFTPPSPPNNQYPWYVARYRPGGQYHWHHYLTDMTCTDRTLRLGGANALYLTGPLYDSTTLGGHHFAKPTGFFNADYLVARLDSNGALQWAQQRTTSSTTTQGSITFGSEHTVVVDTTVYMACVTQGTSLWGGGLSTSNGQAQRGTLVAFGRSGGPAQWVKTIGSTSTSIQHIASDGSSVWITGVGRDSITLRFDTVSIPVPQQQAVPYLAKLPLSSTPTSLTSVKGPAGLQVWPNPATGSVYLRSDAEGLARLFDMWGRAVRTASVKGGDVTALPTALLPRGVYFLELRGDDGTTIQRVVLE